MKMAYIQIFTTIHDIPTITKRPLSKKTNYRLIKGKSIAECSKGRIQISALCLTFVKLPFVIKIFVLSVFQWPFYTGLSFTVYFCW